MAQSGEPVVAGETNTEVGLAGKKSIETVKGVGSIDLYSVFDFALYKQFLMPGSLKNCGIW